MRFITDGMLGKLTRWLRMLGQDVKYSRSLNDEQLLKAAKAESRVLLTRDLKLYQQARKRGVSTIMVEGSTEAEKLASLVDHFGIKLEMDVTVSRCPKCNTPIRTVSKDQVSNRIPETTATYYNEFWECPGCGQIYWQGAHWRRIEMTLEKARKIASTS
ncbi:MAG: Mut7-C RNAse domain-containing protein [Candidatus Bathyarchaeia archaeon]